ncbi:hypothetical protein DFJ74DRAFT_765733 [Hyaloraphidium curvatum]|nr:hypothetical protein DFJ74DRAFT_765733 [Hyaloraphidium curvatum]
MCAPTPLDVLACAALGPAGGKRRAGPPPPREAKKARSGSLASDATAVAAPLPSPASETTEVLHGVPVVTVVLRPGDGKGEGDTRGSPAGNAPPAALPPSRDDCLNGMIDLAVLVLAAAFPSSARPHPSAPSCPLREFVVRMLARSAAPRQVFDLALLLLVRFSRAPAMPAELRARCGRRMFLAALVAASGYLLGDGPPADPAWAAGVCGLPAAETALCKAEFLARIGHRLAFDPAEFAGWSSEIGKWALWLARARGLGSAGLEGEEKEAVRGLVRRGVAACPAALWAAAERV